MMPSPWRTRLIRPFFLLGFLVWSPFSAQRLNHGVTAFLVAQPRKYHSIDAFPSIVLQSNPNTQDEPSTSKKPPRRRRGGKSKRKPSSTKSKQPSIPTTGEQIWRIYGLEVHPDDLKYDPLVEQRYHRRATEPNQQDPDIVNELFLHPAVVKAVYEKLQCQSSLGSIHIVRRSLDARRNKWRADGRGKGPRFTYVVDWKVDAANVLQAQMKPKHVPGKMELLSVTHDEPSAKKDHVSKQSSLGSSDSSTIDTPTKRVIVVGAGPAGLFCALELAKQPNVEVVLLERGRPVEMRGKDIGALMHRRALDSESNFAFGEGGAGTWSDGKLTTRIGRNSDAVRHVLETLVEYGAPPVILVDGAPHLGTDNLVRLLRNLRMALIDYGAKIMFDTQMKRLLWKDGHAQGVEYQTTVKSDNGDNESLFETIHGDAVVLATGHSARDVYEELHASGQVALEAKGFAVGFRVEHPQRLINKLQYGLEWGPFAQTGKGVTDAVNMQYFEKLQKENGLEKDEHERLPVPSYRLATDKANDGTKNRGVYSFCMCPGGQIVPASTESDELCVNGMSFSRRDSVWANSALVVTVGPDDPILDPYRDEHGVLAGLAFQRDMERRAAIMGGGNLTVPVQTVTDFIDGKVSDSPLPSSSYRLGTKASPCHEIYPSALTNALRDALTNYFDKQMPGYVSSEALLHAVETRTSSPVRVSRNDTTMEALGTNGLFPAGEGAGFAGGIVSAAVDGLNVAEAIMEELGIVETNSAADARSKRAGKSAGY